MEESDYHKKSEDCINAIENVLEAADQDGRLEVESQGGILTIAFPSGKQLLVSKHATSRQIWLSSPISGGLHFSYRDGAWALPDGRRLGEVLSQELKQLAGIDLVF